MVDAVCFLYSLVAVIGAAGYLPQIVALWQGRGDARAVSLLTWNIWAASWVISLLYGALYLQDPRFCILAIVNLTGHAAVIGLTLHRRRAAIAVREMPPSPAGRASLQSRSAG